MRVPEVERTVLRQLVLAAKRQPQAIVVGQPCGPVSVVDRCLVEREAHLRGGRGRKEEARLIFRFIRVLRGWIGKDSVEMASKEGRGHARRRTVPTASRGGFSVEGGS